MDCHTLDQWSEIACVAVHVHACVFVGAVERVEVCVLVWIDLCGVNVIRYGILINYTHGFRLRFCTVTDTRKKQNINKLVQKQVDVLPSKNQAMCKLNHC